MFGDCSRRDENKSRRVFEPILGIVKYFRAGHDFVATWLARCVIAGHTSAISHAPSTMSFATRERTRRELIFGFPRVSNYVPCCSYETETIADADSSQKCLTPIFLFTRITKNLASLYQNNLPKSKQSCRLSNYTIIIIFK